MKRRIRVWETVRNYRFRSLFFRNFLMILLIIIIPLAGISIPVYLNSKARIESEITSFNMSSLQRVRDYVDNIYFECQRLALTISMQEEVQWFLVSGQLDYSLDSKKVKIIENIHQFLLIHKYIHSIYIYSEANDYVIGNNSSATTKEMRDDSWLADYERNRTLENFWIVSRKFENAYPYLITISIPIKASSGRTLGMIAINIDEVQLFKLVSSLNVKFSENLIVVDRGGTQLLGKELSSSSYDNANAVVYRGFGAEQSDISTIMDFQGEGSVVSVAASKFAPLNYVSIIPTSDFSVQWVELSNMLIMLILFGILASFITSFLISMRVYRPIHEIISVIGNPQNEDDEPLKQYKNNDELKVIVGNIQSTLKSSEDMGKELNRRLALLNTARTEALQYRISPHFLINTLEAINWMAIGLTHGENGVSTMVTSLADLFRVSMDNTDHLIPISEEIECLKQYIYIISTRYKDMFEVTWGIDEEILNYRIVKLALQPLVENAVYHGIKKKREKGCLWIEGRLLDGEIIMEVRDDGVGMDTEKVDALNQSLEKDYIRSDAHIGMNNVNQRIKLIFGDEYGLRIQSAVHEGTTVTVRFPAIS